MNRTEKTGHILMILKIDLQPGTECTCAFKSKFISEPKQNGK